MSVSSAPAPRWRPTWGRGLILPLLLAGGPEAVASFEPAAVLLAAQEAGDSQSVEEALRERTQRAGVELQVGDIEILGEGLDEEAATQLAELGAFISRRMEADGGTDLFSGSRQYRIRLREAERANHYCGGVAAVTMIEPSLGWIRTGEGGHDPAWTFLQTVVESNWSRIVRPVWSMPIAVRDGLDRAIVEYYLPQVVAEFGEDWWLGGPPPSGTTWGLPADSAYLQDRDRVQGMVRALIQQKGIERLLSMLEFWNTARLTGADAAAQLESLLIETLGSADGAEGDRMLPPLRFETATEWTGPDAERVEGMKYRVFSRGRTTAWTWYGKRYDDPQNRPKTFHSASEGNPAQLFQVASHGRFRISQVDTVMRRVGEFEPGQQFSLLVLNQDGHECFRWTYEISQIPTEAAWLELASTANPQVDESFFLAFEFPPMGEGQDLQIGGWPREGGEHGFVLESGRALRAMPEPRDLALVVNFVVAEANRGQLAREMQKKFGRPR